MTIDEKIRKLERNCGRDRDFYFAEVEGLVVDLIATYRDLEKELAHTVDMDCQRYIALQAVNRKQREALEKIAKGRTDKTPGMSVQSRPLSHSEMFLIAKAALADGGIDAIERAFIQDGIVKEDGGEEGR